MDPPTRWHNLEYSSCPDVNNDTTLYQNFAYTTTEAFQPGGVRNAAALKVPFMPPPHHLRLRNSDSDYSPTSNMASQSSYNTDMMLYSRSPSLVSDNTDTDFGNIAPTSVPSNMPMTQQPMVCRSNRPVKLCPLLTGESTICQPDKCGMMAPCLDFAELPPIEQCVRMPYITPPVQDGDIVNNPFSQNMQQRPHHQQDQQLSYHDRQKRKAAVITPPVSRVSSTEDSESSSDDDMTIVRNAAPSTTSRPNNKTTARSTHPSKNKPAPSSNVVNGKGMGKSAKSKTQDDKETKLSASRLRARQAHSLVERRYRENLNLRINQLQESLQNTKYAQIRSPTHQHQQIQDQSLPPTDYTNSTMMTTTTSMISPLECSPISPPANNANQSLQPMTKLGPGISTNTNTNANTTPDRMRKSDVLVSAMAYIDHAETEMRRMNHEILRLRTRLDSFEHGGRR